MSSVRLEVAIDSAASLRAASLGGADRIELCASLADGGITPSTGMIELAMKTIQIPIHCMVRPRAGDFVYSDDELQIMRRDIALCKSLRVPGVVLGVLKPDGSVDTERLRALIDAARPMRVVFHRAIDVAHHIVEQALDDVIACGVDEVLTSGGADSLTAGSSRVAAMVRQAGGRIRIIGGAGVNSGNALQLWQSTGVDTLHGSFRGAPISHQAEGKPAMGSPEREVIQITSHEEVARAAAALRGGYR